jgi:hypothetical protein
MARCDMKVTAERMRNFWRETLKTISARTANRMNLDFMADVPFQELSSRALALRMQVAASFSEILTSSGELRFNPPVY